MGMSSLTCLLDIKEELLSRKGISLTEFRRVLIPGKANVDVLIDSAFKPLKVSQIRK